MSWSIAHDLVPAGVPLVYDAQNVESQLFAELAASAQGADRVTFRIDARRVAKAENELVGRAHTVMAVSSDDAASLAGDGLAAKVVVQNSVPRPGVVAEPDKSELVILFVGTLDYPPNENAVVELVDEVMPAIRRKVGWARLQIVGRRPTTQLLHRVANTPWLSLAEDVVDVGPYYQRARCVILPIRMGSGTNLKTLEALAFGVPVVGTKTAMRGLERPDDFVLVADTGQDLADAAVDLLTRPQEAARLGAAGRREFIERLAWNAGPQSRLDEMLRGLGPGI